MCFIIMLMPIHNCFFLSFIITKMPVSIYFKWLSNYTLYPVLCKRIIHTYTLTSHKTDAHMISLLQLYTFIIAVHYCFTEMHQCLTYVACLLTRHLSTLCIRQLRMCQFVSLCTAHLYISGVKLCYLYVNISKWFLFCIVTGVTWYSP